MKSWKAIAGSLALLMGISGAAMAQDFDHRDRDWSNNGAYGYRVHDRDDYVYNNGYRNYGYSGYNNGYYGRNDYYGRAGDHDRDDRGSFRDRDHDRNHDRDRDARGDRDRR